MTRTNSTEVRAERASRPKTAGAGAPEPADPADCYVIEPGEENPEYFAPVLLAKNGGLEAAINRAAFLSFAGPAQRITRRRPGIPDRTFLRYQNGRSMHLVT